MSVRVQRRKASFDLTAPNEEQVCITIHLPDEAPQGAVSCTWASEYNVPQIKDVPPSELAKKLEEKIKRKISTHKEEDLEAIEWIHKNAQEVDRLWAERKEKKLEKKISKLNQRLHDLRMQFF